MTDYMLRHLAYKAPEGDLWRVFVYSPFYGCHADHGVHERSKANTLLRLNREHFHRYGIQYPARRIAS